MKKNIKNKASIVFSIHVLIAIFFSYTTYGATNSEFQRGNDNYSKADYNAAISIYTKLLDSGVNSAEVYYNLANAYYKNQQLAYAILYYEKARLLSPNDPDINYNLELAKTQTIDKINEMPQFFLHIWLGEFTNLLSSNQWAITALILLFISLSSIFIFFIVVTPGLKKMFFWIGIGLFIFTIIALTNSATLAREIKNHNYAIVFSPMVTIKSSPEQAGNDLFVIHEGLKIKIIDKVGDWYEIKLIDGNVGWLKNEDIKKI